MKRILALAVLVLGLAAACGPGDNFRDLKGVPSHDPQKVELFNNVDGHPNLAVVCIHGVAFVTTTRDAQAAVQRIPDLDGPSCGVQR